jgi:hypothetical protein
MKPKDLILGLILSSIFLNGCSEKEKVENRQNNLIPKLAKTEYLGCFLEYGNNKSTMDTDTIYYELINDTLLLHVIMNQNCGYCLKDSVIINNELVDIFISDTCGLMANCMCDYDFDYYFTDFSEQMTFTVYYKAIWESEYSFWAELNYP